MNYKGRVSALMMCLALALATSASATVVINYPDGGATVNGVVTVKAQVSNDWWSKLWVDGKGIAVSSIGNVSFRWDSTTVSDGSHVLIVNGYPSGQPANSSDKVTVIVNNHSSSGSSTSTSSRHFGTLSSGASLPSDATCASEIPWEQEMIPANQGANHTMPTQAQLYYYVSHGYGASIYNGGWAYKRVDGHYTGNTDMIFRWAACKWGIDEDVVRAQATDEHWSWVQVQSGGDKRTSYSQCVNHGFTSLWDYQCSNCCYLSWSIFQTKVYYNWQTWPIIVNSTAFAADYHYASMRACMDGDIAPYFSGRPAYNGHTYAKDIAGGNLSTILWGCIGYHYSGNWYDSGAVSYMNKVKSTLAQKPWKSRWPSVNWPD